MPSQAVIIDPICGHPITASDLEREIRLLRVMGYYLPKNELTQGIRNITARKIKTARKMLRGAK